MHKIDEKTKEVETNITKKKIACGTIAIVK